MQWISFELFTNDYFSQISSRYPEILIARWSGGTVEVLQFLCRDPITLAHVRRDILHLEKTRRLRVIKNAILHYDTLVTTLKITKNRSKRQLDPQNILGKFSSLVFFPIVYRKGAEYFRFIAIDEEHLPEMFRKLERLGKVRITARIPTRDLPVEESLTLSSGELFSKFTDKQGEALISAVELGYFRVPRRIKFEDLAGFAGMPRTTFETHVRKAESKVMKFLVPYLQAHFGRRYEENRLFPEALRNFDSHLTDESFYASPKQGRARNKMFTEKNHLILTNEYFKAIKDGEAAKVEQMVQRKADLVNAHNESDMSGVVVATYYGQPEIAEFLISHGANLNFFEAAMCGKLDVVKQLAEENPSKVNSFSTDGFTALHLASFFGSMDIVRFLIRSGAEVNAVAKNMMKVMPLHSAVARNQFEISKLLVSSGADVNSIQEGGITPLHESAQNGNVEITKLLLENGAAINAKSADGRTPLALTKTEGREAGTRENREKVAAILRQHGGKE